ncbi:hypothetical protein MSAN_00553300 [Mycena sanguinolenta]|uniref:Uncharacterized protein n=1 Tax=Mycena sanguinolenta TaxID=230812 RepID=A0A8H7DHK0_9AGAR|nr:hypothetical protein MSAN_00553300 [Mycena sanguinolenta]
MPILARELLQVSEYSKRDVPRIGGSEGGFIALVIGLVVIILGSSVAIYILLRDHTPSEREREARREERRYPSESSRSSFKSRLPWSEKLGGMFGRGTTSSKRSSKSGRGWIQASDDAWEEGEADYMRSRELKRVDPPFRPPVDPYAASYSSDSVPYDPPLPATIRSDFPIPRSTSPESTVHPSSPSRLEQTKERHFSVESSTSLRTFEGGTKFIEVL